MFEVALESALAGVYGPTAYSSIVSAVRDAFIAMDRQIETAQFGGIYRFQEFLGMFMASSSESYTFTVNQDLLIERSFFNWPVTSSPPALPGVPLPGSIDPGRQWFTSLVPTYSSALDVRIPSVREPVAFHNQFNYVKLHGSFNWLDETGNLMMVMGPDKSGQIRASWLLSE
ncbi:MAG TPA: hypothetical protein VKT78_19985, partial [Fimbriimonadaceae bacterium]|nr:hypothetical protein [Fimbriimonadaceae bacterium]